MNPRVYVGTYGKYNNGSLAGGWLSLKDCKDYKQFLSKCRALHRGERDPEFMIQDCEGFPDGLSCGEWLSEQDFNDVIEACREEEAEEQTTLADRLRAALLLQMGGKAAPKGAPRSDDKALLEEYMQEWTKVWKDKGMLDYERKKFSGAIRLENGGILYFEKPSIDHEFCFHDEGADYEFYKDVTKTEQSLKDYFLERNLRKFDEQIKDLQKLSKECRDWYIQRASYSGETEKLNLWTHKLISDWDLRDHPSWYGDVVKMSEADRKAILAATKRERDKFEKRLQTYLKRYGTSKIRTWTYWADA